MLSVPFAPPLSQGIPAYKPCTLTVSSTVRSFEGGVACGDVVFALPLDTDRTALVVIDIAGHGAARAPLSSVLADTIAVALRRGASPSGALAAADERLRTFDDASPYAVGFIAIVHPALRTVVYASAGHDVAFTLAEDGRTRPLLPTAPMLGIPLPNCACDALFELEPNEMLVIATDGVGDSRPSGSDDFFGSAGVARALAHSRRTGDHPARAVLEAAFAHAGGRQTDDAAVMVARVPAPQRTSRSTSSLTRAVLGIALACWCALIAPAVPARAQPTVDVLSVPITPLLPPATDPPAWAAFKDAWANVNAYSSTVTFFERQGTQTQNSVFDYTFHKPANATVHFLKGPHAGAILVWGGADTVTAQLGSGLMGLFKKRLSLHDPLVMTIRGASIDQLSFAGILLHSQNTPGTLSQGPGPSILGIPTEAVTLIPTSSVTNTGLTHEIVDIPAVPSLPIRVLGYEGEMLVRQIEFSNIKLMP